MRDWLHGRDWTWWLAVIMFIICSIALANLLVSAITEPARHASEKATAKAQCLDAGNTFNDGDKSYWCSIEPRGR